MFNAKIVRQQGGSELHMYSGASQVWETGSKQTGTQTYGAGSIVRESGSLETFKAGASLKIAAGPSATVMTFVNGTSLPSIYVGFDVPSFIAQNGSIYIRTQGSMSGLFVNIGQDATASSSWRAFQQGSAIG